MTEGFPVLECEVKMVDGEWKIVDRYKSHRELPRMDDKTYALYARWYETLNDGFAYSPLMLIELAGRSSGSVVHQSDYRQKYDTHKREGHVAYAELYRILAYTIFGYGHWSNNDRRKHGLGTIPHSKMWRSKMRRKIRE